MNLVLVVGILALCLSSVGAKKRVMSWLCLEFCEETEDDVATDMKQIERYKDVFSAVSFEKYTLGPNCTLLDNELIPVSDDIQALGLEAWPLLSSFPHYPEFIDWMREVFASPQVFIDQCVSEAAKYGYHGYNLDWEPTDDCTEQDGNDYANFIQTFAQGLHQNGLKLSVDYAGWSPIWNLTAIAESEADYIITLSSEIRVPSVALAKERRANVQTSLIKSSLLGLIISWQRVTSSMYESVFSYLMCTVSFTALQLSSHSRAVVLSYFTRYAHAGTVPRAGPPGYLSLHRHR